MVIRSKMDVSLSGVSLSADGGSCTGGWSLVPLKAISPGDSMLLYREQLYFAILTRSSAQSSFYAPPAPRGAPPVRFILTAPFKHAAGLTLILC
mgnify:CR=1 FL=1